jgi:hypothetical protein
LIKMARISNLAVATVPAERDVIPISDGQLTKKITFGDLRQNIVRQASTTTLGSVRVGQGLTISDTGVLSVRNFSGYVLPPATTETLGGIRVGPGLSISETSVLSVDYELPIATPTILGGVKLGTGISIDNNGVISVTTANVSGGSLGAVPYQLSSSNTTLLPGNITTVKKFLAQTGTGTSSTAPFWTTVYNSLPIAQHQGTIVNINVATGTLPVARRDGITVTVTLIS